MTNFVNWPGFSDPEWRNTGEGGLYAYAVWDDVAKECFVDTFPRISVADVFIAAHGPLSSDFGEQYRRYAHDHDYTDYEARDHRHEISFDAVLFVGSTIGSFYSDHAGSYFSVDRIDLNPEGLRVIETLEAVYGSKATFVTYLDT